MSIGGQALLLSTIQDITERKQVEESLRREQSLLDSVIRATDVMLIFLDRQFNFVWVNPAYAETCRMRPEDMVGNNHFALYPNAENEAIFRKVRDSGDVVFYKDKPFVFPDQPERGTTYWDWSLTPVKDNDGATAGLVFSLRETTKYKRAQEALRQGEERFRALVMASSQAIYRMSSDWTEMNQLYGRGFLADTEEPSRSWLQKYIHPDDQPPVIAVIDEAIRTKSIFELEHRVRRADGSLGWTFSRAVPLMSADGDIVEWFGVAGDITERKQAEEALCESEEKYRAVRVHGRGLLYHRSVVRRKRETRGLPVPHCQSGFRAAERNSGRGRPANTGNRPFAGGTLVRDFRKDRADGPTDAL